MSKKEEIMRVIGYLKKNHKIINSCDVNSEEQDVNQALIECMEKIYRIFDIAEPVWLSKHSADLSKFYKTHFHPDDFMEDVNFDSFEIELIL